MNLEDLRTRRQERRTRAEIMTIGTQAAEVVLNFYGEGIKPPYRVNVSAPPANLSPEEFSEKVGEVAVDVLHGELRDVPVIYNPAVSKQATDEFAAVHPTQKPPKGPDPVVVVFTEAPTLH